MLSTPKACAWGSRSESPEIAAALRSRSLDIWNRALCMHNDVVFHIHRVARELEQSILLDICTRFGGVLLLALCTQAEILCDRAIAFGDGEGRPRQRRGSQRIDIYMRRTR